MSITITKIKRNELGSVEENRQFADCEFFDTFFPTSFINCSFSDCVFDYAIFRGASFNNCSFANCSFVDTDFSGTSFPGCTFTGSDLSRAVLLYAVDDGVYFKNFFSEPFHYTLTRDTLRAGCEFHSAEDFLSFSTERIGEMHPSAVSSWARVKPSIQSLWESNSLLSFE